MTFSKRVGMEPATDLKKRICSLCEEAGFTVASASISMRREDTLQESVRMVLVYVHEPTWNPSVPESYVGTDWEKHKMFQMEIRAFIGVDGTFGGEVQIVCSAKKDVGDAFSPTLRDCKIPIAELPQWLPEIARQMREVISGRERGEKGPWHFGSWEWKHWA